MLKTRDLLNDSINLLLIEDDPDAARLVREMLKQAGKVDLRLDHATSLQEGLELYK